MGCDCKNYGPIGFRTHFSGRIIEQKSTNLVAYHCIKVSRFRKTRVYGHKRHNNRIIVPFLTLFIQAPHSPAKWQEGNEPQEQEVLGIIFTLLHSRLWRIIHQQQPPLQIRSRVVCTLTININGVFHYDLEEGTFPSPRVFSLSAAHSSQFNEEQVCDPDPRAVAGYFPFACL